MEVEAYGGTEDRASHARFGLTDRNREMFGEPGRAYLYRVYGMHICLNVVTEPAGSPAAVLIRAVEVREGIEIARASRVAAAVAGRRVPPTGEDRAIIERRIAALPAARLAAGPGLVGAAFGLELWARGLDLCDSASPLRLEPDSARGPASVEASARLGVAFAGDPWASAPWRFFDPVSASVSR